MVDVTVVVPTFNRARYLGECLGSILGQTLAPAQVIVVNDGSTDSTREVLRPFLDRIEYLEKDNGGKSTALNMAFAKVGGDYIWIFDDDDVAIPDALERHIALLERRPDLGMSYSSYYRAGTHPDGSINPGDDVRAPRVDPECFFLRLMEANFIAHPSAVVRTEGYRKVGRFDTDLVRSQDYDMLLRLARCYLADMIHGPTFYRRYHEGSRGSQRDLFRPEHYDAKAFGYEKIIFRRLRREADLNEFLPRDPGSTRTQLTDDRRALLQRAAIMALKGLWTESFEDLDAAIRADSSKSLTGEEKRICTTALRSGPALAEIFDAGADSALLAVCRGTIGGEIAVNLARGGYHQLRSRNPELGWQHRQRLWSLVARLLAKAGRSHLIPDIRA